ncbi:MAG: hypothetical protein K0R26_1925 [Bacteroidota bacterium]|jgi:hypothetical protein|nr:hypothetical protein [Bacteroidota bacterium]
MDRVLIGLSGGINSMAVLCWLSEQPVKPKEVHLFYAHFKEHSPDTFQFVADGIRFARKHFEVVKVRITKNSILDFFRKEKIIPHPANSPCTKRLKIDEINAYAFENDIKIDLVGYVRHELKRRSERQKKNISVDLFSLQKLYPIGEFNDEWCFQIVERLIGWFPEIYKILDENGNRVFKHNNCLPCKNMDPEDILAVKKYYPKYFMLAMKLSSELTRYWGRDEATFYTTFGRDLGQENTCNYCKF